MCILTYWHGYMHTHVHAYVHIYIHTHMHTCLHTHMHACMDACIHSYIHTYMHTCLHIKILMDTYTQQLSTDIHVALQIIQPTQPMVTDHLQHPINVFILSSTFPLPPTPTHQHTHPHPSPPHRHPNPHLASTPKHIVTNLAVTGVQTMGP